jgi:pimeloyl-ACP methyl ester carboxylesterase
MAPCSRLRVIKIIKVKREVAPAGPPGTVQSGEEATIRDRRSDYHLLLGDATVPRAWAISLLAVEKSATIATNAAFGQYRQKAEEAREEMGEQPPAWLDTAEYPFAPHGFTTEAGRMHWIQVGTGDPIVFVHGTPTWSFDWRHLIKGLSGAYRCLALDHLGFGLSDKPQTWTYRPEDHARNFAAWVEHLGLKDITLVVHDFGGPIGLGYALDRPENVRAVVLLNTWMWSLADDPHFALPGRLLSGRIGRYLYEQSNFSVRNIMPTAYGDRKRLTPKIHAQYINALATPADRQGTFGMLRGLLGSTAWYESLWARHERLRDIPLQILWGMKDSAFRAQELDRWRDAFPAAEVHPFADAGHWPQEEAPDRVLTLVQSFLARLPR